MENQLEIFYRLFNHNQETFYIGSYDMSFKPFITEEGKLKYQSKVDGVNQTRHMKWPFKMKEVVGHLVGNHTNTYCDENGLGDKELYIDYKKPVITKTQIGKHQVLNNWDHGVVLNQLGPDGRGVYGAIDVDVYNKPELLERVIKQIYSENIPLVPCYSKSNGLHLYLFSNEPFEYFEIDNALKYFNKKLNINAKELFPKQPYKPGKFGNGIALPYRSTVLKHYNNLKFDFNPMPNVLIKEDLSLGTIDEFLVRGQKIKDTWTKEYWNTIPIMQKEKKVMKRKI